MEKATSTDYSVEETFPSNGCVCTSQEESQEESQAEITLLRCGIVSIDGLEGMDHAQALAVAQHSAALSNRIYRSALGTLI